MKRHCSYGCIHCTQIEIPGSVHDDGIMKWRDPSRYIRTCDLYPEKYFSWMEQYGQIPRNQLSVEDYKCFDECYEADKISSSLNEMIALSEEILDKLNKRK